MHENVWTDTRSINKTILSFGSSRVNSLWTEARLMKSSTPVEKSVSFATAMHFLDSWSVEVIRLRPLSEDTSCNVDGQHMPHPNCNQKSLTRTWWASERNNITPLEPLYRRDAWRLSSCFDPSWNKSELVPLEPIMKKTTKQLIDETISIQSIATSFARTASFISSCDAEIVQNTLNLSQNPARTILPLDDDFSV